MNNLAGSSEGETGETRQEHRQKRQQSQRRRMPKHGAGLKRVYPDAVAKRLKQQDKKT